MIKAVIFDMDGLLMDSQPLWYEADNQVLGKYEKVFPVEERAPFMGMDGKEFVSLLKKKFSLPESEKELRKKRLEAIHNLLEDNLKLMPGARNLLNRVSEEGYLLALATGAGRKTMNLMLKKLKIKRYFPITVSSEEVARGKPAPDIFLEVAKRLKAKPGKCAVLEDAIKGVLAAKAAGMKAIAVYDARYNRPENYPAADLIFKSLEEIDIKVIKSL